MKAAVIPYDPLPHQRIFHAWQPEPNELLIKAIVTGYGGGKSHAFVREIFSLAVENAPIPVMAVEPTYPMISDILVPAFDELFDDAGIVYEYNQQRKAYNVRHVMAGGKRHPIGARILLRSGDNPSRLKGSNLAAAGIDEPFIQSREVYKQVLARIRHPRARRRTLVLAGTPEGMGWGAEELVDKTKHIRTETVIVRGEPVHVNVYEGPGRKWVQTSSAINDALDEDYIATLREAHTELEAGAYIGGQFQHLAQGRVYYAYDASQNDRAYELDYSLPVIVACDFNATEAPMSWNIMQERDGATYVRHALWRQYTNTHAMCEYLHEVLTRDGRGLPRALVFYGDYSGTHDRSNSTLTDWQIIESYFRPLGPYDRHGLRLCYKPCKSIRVSASAVNARLCNANGDRRMFLHPGEDTEHLRRDFNLVTWRENGTKEDDTDHMRTHAGSAMRYYCDYEHPALGKPVRTI